MQKSIWLNSISLSFWCFQSEFTNVLNRGETSSKGPFDEEANQSNLVHVNIAKVKFLFSCHYLLISMVSGTNVLSLRNLFIPQKRNWKHGILKAPTLPSFDTL